MAFPYYWLTDSTHGTITSNSTTWTITYPTNLVTNDLIVVMLGSDGINTASGWPSGFLTGVSNGSGVQMNFGKKKSDGTETGTFDLTMANSEQGCWRAFRFSQWEGTHGTFAGNSVTSGACVHTFAGGPTTDANPAPPTLDPANWATEDTLWIVGFTQDQDHTVSVYPYSDNNEVDSVAGNFGTTMGYCTTQSAVSSLSPGTFTTDSASQWIAFTVAVRPGTAGAARPTPSSVPLIPGGPGNRDRFRLRNR